MTKIDDNNNYSTPSNKNIKGIKLALIIVALVAGLGGIGVAVFFFGSDITHFAKNMIDKYESELAEYTTNFNEEAEELPPSEASSVNEGNEDKSVNNHEKNEVEVKETHPPKNTDNQRSRRLAEEDHAGSNNNTVKPQQEKEQTTSFTTLNLSYATYKGRVKNGKANGKGTMTYLHRTRISEFDSEKRYAEPGYYIEGIWYKNQLDNGRLYDEFGNFIETITIGRAE